MNSWDQNQTQNNMTTGFPYQNMWGNYQQSRMPIYHAEPIHGEMAAWQYLMGPNSEIYLPDAEKDIIWWIRTDNNNNRTVLAFDVKPHEEQPPVDLNEIIERLAVLEEKVNAKSNKPNAKPTVSD